ncbi:acyl-CoA dehydrogenase family protein [Kordiimonas laminariae]|uniref:acyl-CoA dehydrogenase family protein n=1 Tax=Kordiimonas laminariae TaxID=2917717 RepID=UPI001FF2E061|nr:acyl-CoA dehydrogenase family protein [Kordiimonas laminariae]MCK0070367.1 acyl-CoA/acyl-ACP dehydrogenase [Kordiimonas laminariae]
MDMVGTIGLTEEQADLLEVATNFCRDKSPIEKVRELLEDDLGYDPDVWKEVAELGWLAIALPEEYGGVGLSLAEVVPVVEQMGRNLMATPFVSTSIAAQAIIAGGTEAQKKTYLPKIAEGMAATVALSEDNGDWDLLNIEASANLEGNGYMLSGTKTFVCDAHSAEIFIVSAALDGGSAKLFIVEKDMLPEGSIRRETVIDETRRSFKLCLDGVGVHEIQMMDVNQADAALAHIHMVQALLLSAEMCGGAFSTIEYTLDYLRTRKQFDKIVGSYQALKHPIVDAHISYEHARSHLYSAAHNFDKQGEQEVAVRMAKSKAGEAFSYAADRSIQFHGGFGFTYECDAQLYRRRSLWCEHMAGDGAYHREKLAALMF